MLTPRIEAFLARREHDTPLLVVDLDVVRERYLALQRALPDAAIFYAVKANPAAPILELLTDLGSSFDVASPAELDACIEAGADPSRIAYTSTVKKRQWVADAYSKGVRLFAMDSEPELRKIVAEAPDATVCCRILCDNTGADWPLSMKFGCDPALAVRLLRDAHAAGLGTGVSFHVGSQQRDIDAWDRALVLVARIFDALRADGIAPKIVNIGGGLPGSYVGAAPDVAQYGAGISRMLRARLGDDVPFVIVEPGRYLVADAGVLQTEVMLVARKSQDADRRWVYLDVGVFGGLAETMGEAIRYKIRTPHDGAPTQPAVIAGPTCDSVDVLYERDPYPLPLPLAAGDRVEFLSAGAYTTTYASVGFNGFPPLAAVYLPSG